MRVIFFTLSENSQTHRRAKLYLLLQCNFKRNNYLLRNGPHVESRLLFTLEDKLIFRRVYWLIILFTTDCVRAHNLNNKTEFKYLKKKKERDIFSIQFVLFDPMDSVYIHFIGTLDHAL